MKMFMMIGGVLSMLVGGVYYNSSNIDEITLENEQARAMVIHEIKKDNPESLIVYDAGENLILMDDEPIINDLVNEKLEIVRHKILARIAKEKEMRILRAKQEDCRNRLKALKHPNIGFYKHYNDIPNRVLEFKKRCLNEPDFAFVEKMEDEQPNSIALVEAQKNRALLRKNAKLFFRDKNCLAEEDELRKNACLLLKGR